MAVAAPTASEPSRSELPAAPAGATWRPAGTPLWAMLLRPFALPFALLLGVGLAVLVGVDRNARSSALVSASQTRLTLIGALGGDISAMENGERGFVITGNADFLEPYTIGRSKFATHAYALEYLSVSDQQRSALNAVREVVGRWQREAAAPEIGARRLSAEEAVALVSGGSGKGILDEARSQLAAMQDDENARLSQVTTSSQETLNRVRWLTISGLGLGMLLLLVTAWRVARDLSRSLERLTGSAREIAAGQYHVRLPDSPVRELSVLGRQIDLMALAVQQREQELRVANGKLERSNRELEQFTYVASHDLQEPLRTITSYTELLSRRYRGRLDERADQYMAFTTTAASRMKTLIQDLLAYSRMRQGQRTLSAVQTGPLLRSVLDDLRALQTDSGGQVELPAAPPTVWASADLLRHVFHNLIGNALKFCAPQRPPLVVVGARHDGVRWVFSVQDNGIGIEPQYHERIFGVFQRLHGPDDYGGSGIGLSMARSAAEQLGGELWLESTPGEGSTFYFSVPDGVAGQVRAG